MKKFYWSTRCFQKIKDFYQEEKGVYAVMTALLSFPLLVLIAFTVDGTGIILDKVRLAQATDQAALLLVAENNTYRKNAMHKDVTGQKISPEDKEKFSGNELDAKKDKRNQELIQGLAKMYLRSEDKVAKDKNLPVTIDAPFHYDCYEVELKNPKNQYSQRRPVTCYVNGSVNREFWIPLSAELVKTKVTRDGRLSINSGTSYAVKEKGLVIPVELMLVSDFSGSMEWVIGQDSVTEPKDKTKIFILRSVVKEIQDTLFPTDPSKSASPYNRMGFVTFAGGARQENETSQCVMPYYLKKDNQEFRVEWNDISKLSVTGPKNSSDCEQKQAGVSRGKTFHINICKVSGNPHNAFRLALKHTALISTQLIFTDMLDVNKTIAQIDHFNGKPILDYDLRVPSGGLCLGGNDNKKTTQAWFDKKDPNISRALNAIQPKGGTAASSGVLIGANLLMKKNDDPEASPDKLGTNTQRVLMVLSDGEDNQPSGNALVTLINAGMCDRIRKQADTLQDPKYDKLPTKIAFAAFGFKPPKEQKEAWKKCVGESNYYEPNSREDLIKAFKQILSFEEEVGRSSIKKPTF